MIRKTFDYAPVSTILAALWTSLMLVIKTQRKGDH